MRQTPLWALSASKETRTPGGRTACPCCLGLEEEWGLGVGGSFWEPGLPADLRGVSQHLFTYPASQKSRTPHGAPNGCECTTQIWWSREGYRLARMHVGMSVQTGATVARCVCTLMF